MTPFTLNAADRPTRVHHVPGDGPPVLLVHGASGNALTWAPTLRAWSWADVYVVDLPGRGVSAEPLDRIPELAGWLGEVIDQLHPPQAPIVVGHSLGGAIGLQLALDQPDTLGGLAMVASSARLKVAPAILDAVANTTPDRPLDLSFAFGPDTKPFTIERYAASARGVPTQAALADWRACNAFDVREHLDQVQVPVRVIYGTEDRLTPARHQRHLIDALPDATGVEVEGGGHMLPWEAPSAVAGAIREFTG